MKVRPSAVQAAVPVALIKIGLGLAGVAGGLMLQSAGLPPRYFLMAAHVAVYAAAGLFLLLGGRRDHRAQVLGVVFLLIASVFSDGLLWPFRETDFAGSVVVRGVRALPIDAFLPYFLWAFVTEFPRAADSGKTRTWLRLALHVSGGVGAVIFSANLLLFALWLDPGVSALERVLQLFSRTRNAGLYWTVQFILAGAAFFALGIRARRAPIDERRRTSLLAGGLIAGTAPAIIWLLAWSASPVVESVLPLRRAGWVIYPALLSMPLSTAYAVAVRQALDVTLVVRRAIQYLLARYTVMVAATVPLVLLAVDMYRRRDESIARIVSSPERVVLLSFCALGVVALRRRRGLLDAVDRAFFREQYDSRRILGDLVHRCRWAGSRRELTEVLRTGIDRALHLTAVEVLFLSDDAASLVSLSDDVRPLEARSALVGVLAAADDPLDVDLEWPNSVVARLPDSDRHWLADTGFRLMLPLRDPNDVVLGILALGEKKSELPYSSEDRRLLAGVASAAEMTVAYHRLHSPPQTADHRSDVQSSEPLAAECIDCGAVQPAGAVSCARCGRPVRECVLPQTIGGKFRLERRIGAGGMGIVYRAVDLHLGRVVAIKTLPYVAPDQAVRLRREARAMALVSHPNLALIFGAETWQGRPMIVVEYLGAGTLADRLAAGPLPLADVLDLGVALAAALDAIHSAGLLHRDIKPSNIGFGQDGAPKLLDFGLARILGTSLQRASAPGGRERHSGPSDRPLLTADQPAAVTEQGAVIGTLQYMSPEAIRGAAPEPSFDIWSLCLVLYEAIAGRHPYSETTPLHTRARVTRGEIPDIRHYAPATPGDVADFFAGALAVDAAERPRSAGAVSHALRALRRTADHAFVAAGVSAPLARGL